MFCKEMCSFVPKNDITYNKMLLPPLLALVSLFMPNDSVPADTARIDTLKEVEVHGDSILRVNDAIRQSIERETGRRIGTKSVSDIIGGKATDVIMHPFAFKDRKRERKHARDRKILEEYEKLGRIKTFEELLDEAIRQQAIEDGKEPPKGSGKKK